MELPSSSVRKTAQVPAVGELERWLQENDKSQGWLVDEINRLRKKLGIKTRVGRATIWRWENERKISIDDAVLVETATRGGVPVSLWSRHNMAKIAA
jgi:hypothetical protein